MRKFPFFALLAGLFVMTTASTCEWNHDDDDDHGGNSSSDVTSVTGTATSGTWRVDLYSDSGNDETAQFADFQFTFTSNNSILATNGENSYTGNWSISDSSGKHGSDDDSSSDDLDFNISFASPDRFAELTEDWEIISISNNRIELIHISGGNGSTDYITFVKI
ncbi:MAG: hypothetical protein EOO50_04450 [Flavobacterium sp.]|nr:MAG: hypothetical protein EOO50_04450 [Flavobacterium sp.]